MNKIVVFAAIETVGVILLTAAALRAGGSLLIGIIGSGLALLSAALLYFAVKQDKLMEFLIADNRKQKQREIQSTRFDAEEVEKLKLVKKRVELSTLQSQINPHFLYNTLDCIRSKALLDGQKEIASMMEVLSKFFRYCIRHDENLVKVREEINHIRDYLFIQKYRFENRFDVEIAVEAENLYDLYMPKMTLQPVVENAMIHGLEKITHKGVISIRLFCTDKKMVIRISDNGAGMNMEQLEKLNSQMQTPYMEAMRRQGDHSGIAVNNVNARIKITMGEEYGLHYRSQEGQGTDVVISLPIIDDFTRIKYEEY